LAGL
jgi:hypothetical protein